LGLGFERGDQGVEHPADFGCESFTLGNEGFFAEFEMARENELASNFRIGASCDGKEVDKFTLSKAAVSFRDIAGDGDRGAPQLVGEAEYLFFGEGPSERIDLNRQFDGTLPDR
jgi:hypothetical protein